MDLLFSDRISVFKNPIFVTAVCALLQSISKCNLRVKLLFSGSKTMATLASHTYGISKVLLKLTQSCSVL